MQGEKERFPIQNSGCTGEGPTSCTYSTFYPSLEQIGARRGTSTLSIPEFREKCGGRGGGGFYCWPTWPKRGGIIHWSIFIKILGKVEEGSGMWSCKISKCANCTKSRWEVFRTWYSRHRLRTKKKECVPISDHSLLLNMCSIEFTLIKIDAFL